jgi:hypothetical protein
MPTPPPPFVRRPPKDDPHHNLINVLPRPSPAAPNGGLAPPYSLHFATFVHFIHAHWNPMDPSATPEAALSLSSDHPLLPAVHSSPSSSAEVHESHLADRRCSVQGTLSPTLRSSDLFSARHVSSQAIEAHPTSCPISSCVALSSHRTCESTARPSWLRISGLVWSSGSCDPCWTNPYTDRIACCLLDCVDV